MADAAARIYFLVAALLSFHCAITYASNVALNKAVTLSSMAPHWNRSASLAVDGNKNKDFYTGNCVATSIESDPWLRIDLGKMHYVKSVTVFTLKTDLYYVHFGYMNSDHSMYKAYEGLYTLDGCIDKCRSDQECRQVLKGDYAWKTWNCYRIKNPGKHMFANHQYIENVGKSLSNLHIGVSNSVSGTSTLCVNHQNVIQGGKATTLSCTQPVRGRYVTLKVTGNNKILRLCEVEVHTVDPVQITVHGLSSDAITLTWTACEFGTSGGGAAHKFNLQNKKNDGNSEWTTTNVTAKEYTATSLQYNTEYKFRISCYWTDGTGSSHLYDVPGEKIIKTHCKEPKAVTIGKTTPRLSGSKTNPTATIAVSWTEISDSESGCYTIKHYIVKHKLRSESVWSDSDPITTLSYAISNLKTYMQYAVQVVVYNNKDKKKGSEIKDVDTPQGWSSAVSAPQYTSSPDMLSITWNAPDKPNGIIAHYLVSYKLDKLLACSGYSTSAWSSAERVSTRLHVISKLRPYIRYRVRIVPVNGAGFGLEYILDASTSSLVPRASPTGLSILSKSSQSCSISWNALPCEERNGHFRGYNLTFKGKEYDKRILSIFQATATTWQTSGLVPYALYGFQVAAFNNRGMSAYSDEVTVRLDEAEPPVVTMVRVYDSRENSLGIIWRSPYPPHGVLLRYEVMYSRTGKKTASAYKSSTGTKTSILLYGLEIMQNYSIQVRGRTSAGWCVWSDVIFGFTEEGVPEEPQLFTVKSRGTTSLTFEWKTPNITNGQIIGYKVACGLENSNDHSEETNQLSLTVQGLKTGRKYLCAVAAKTSKGFGMKTEVEVWTKPAKPPKPTVPSFQADRTTDTTITITLPQSHRNAGYVLINFKNTFDSAMTWYWIILNIWIPMHIFLGEGVTLTYHEV